MSEQDGRTAAKVLWGDDDFTTPFVPRRPAAGRQPGRIEADPERVERGLVQLVLTVIELLRELMERQAVRRLEQGALSPEQEEQLGTALHRLAETMEQLKTQFDLDDEDLNLDLGPLGTLL